MSTKDDNMEEYDAQVEWGQDPGSLEAMQAAYTEMLKDQQARRVQEEHSTAIEQATEQDLQAAVVGGWDLEKYQEEIYWATQELQYKYRVDEDE